MLCDLGIGVQQAAHGVGPGQALPGVLAVDVEQLLADRAQLLAVAGLPLTQARLLPWVSTVRRSSRHVVPLSKPASSSMACSVGGVEFGADIGARSTLADHAGVGARAGDQLQRVNQDGLARAGFTGQAPRSRTPGPAPAR